MNFFVNQPENLYRYGGCCHHFKFHGLKCTVVGFLVQVGGGGGGGDGNSKGVGKNSVMTPYDYYCSSVPCQHQE